ncbi:Retrovirus-related Pol polyprotein from transposon RE1 [Vitis vinifera]|uniref:Retrovirus-related Pol polyprotein from transposon RE1 n=1 Tax=Vitis vinifera TaxID=29760 RepID=A0A438G7A8_VITVI|nr:Retrovirus-related Pol polyprotein from transposon RE1 [Vitis vinifera]
MHATSKRDQFLMKLRPNFEIARSNMMNRHPVPSLDACLSELLLEQRIVTQATMEHRANVSAPVSVAYATQGRNKGQDMRVVQCFNCKDFGHIARDCPKKFCNYYKKQGHTIFVCPIRPERKQGTTYHASTSASSSTALPAASSVVPIPVPTALANTNTLTPEMPWYFDSGASNHMMNIVLSLSNVRNYDGNLKINTVDGSSLPISVVGDLSSSLTDVFGSPDLSTNLLSVVSGKMIAKGLKVGRLFPLHVSPSTIIPSFPLLSFASCSSLDLYFDYTSCKLGKSKVLPFPHSASRASQCFDIMHSDVWGIAPIVSHAHYNIKVLRSDSGGKYMSNEFQDFLQSKGIISQCSCPSTPQQTVLLRGKITTFLMWFKPGFVYERRSRHESNSTSSMPLPILTRRLILVLLPPLFVGKTFFVWAQAGARAWFEKFCSAILSFSFTQSQYDSFLFFHTSVSGIILLLVYVDDIIITGTDCGLITKLQQLLHTTFHMQDLRQLTYFLGFEVHHQASGIFVNQHKYIQDLITLAGLKDTFSIYTPMEFNASSAIFEVHLLVGCSFLLDLSSLVAYSDADWARNKIVFLNPLPRSSIMPCLLLVLKLYGYVVFLRSLGFSQTTSTPLHADNTSAIQIATNPFFMNGPSTLRLIVILFETLWESRVISLPHISFDLQVVDIFTKALTRQQHQFLVGKLLLVDLPTSI